MSPLVRLESGISESNAPTRMEIDLGFAVGRTSEQAPDVTRRPGLKTTCAGLVMFGRFTWRRSDRRVWAIAPGESPSAKTRVDRASQMTQPPNSGTRQA